MFDVVKLFREFWRLIQPLSARHYILTLAFCVGTGRLFFDNVDLRRSLLLALLINPILAGAVVLLLFILRYHRRARSLLHGGSRTALERSYRAISQLTTFHHQLRRLTLSSSVPLAYAFTGAYLRTSSARVGINRGDSAESDAQSRGDVVHHELLEQICSFASLAIAKEPERVAALESVCATIERTVSRFVAKIVRATYHDGPGIASTLGGLLRVHFVAVLPASSRRRVIASLGDLDFEPELYGWLSSRVFELVVEVALEDDGKGVSELGPLCAGITELLRSALPDDDVFHKAKFEARSILMGRIRSRLDR